MDIDLTTLSLRELKTLVASAEDRLELITSRSSAVVVRRKLAAAAAKAGYTLEELFGEQATPADEKKARAPRRKKLGKVAPKYRDPHNKRHVWSGRGKMPRWLVAKTQQGRSPTDFLIPGLAKPTLRKGAKVGQKTVFKQG